MEYIAQPVRFLKKMIFPYPIQYYLKQLYTEVHFYTIKSQLYILLPFQQKNGKRLNDRKGKSLTVLDILQFYPKHF